MSQTLRRRPGKEWRKYHNFLKSLPVFKEPLPDDREPEETIPVLRGQHADFEDLE